MSASVVIFTALPIEYRAIRAHLTNLREEIHPKGNVYETGIFTLNDYSIKVGIVLVRKGNIKAGVQTERAITHFNPNIVLFVGVAGGIKDVNLGDVVVADKLYGYESGKAKLTFQARPELGITSFKMVERAYAELRKNDWIARILISSSTKPRVFVGPIAAGDKVISSKRSSIFKFIKSNYSDSLAVEMEGYGFLEATHANKDIDSLVIRGISDLISSKSNTEREGWQEIASANASAFAFEILAKLISEGYIKATPYLPSDIKELLEDSFSSRDLGKYDDAINIFAQALELAKKYENSYAEAKVKYGMSIISHEWNHDNISAKILLKDCLKVFQSVSSDKDIARTLYQLGIIEIDNGNLNDAEAYLTQALEIDRKDEKKEEIAYTLHQLGWIEDHRGHYQKALEYYDKAMNYFIQLYHDESIKDDKMDIIHGIAGCYHHKGLVYEQLGNVEEVQSNYIRSLEWHRKSGFKPDIGRILYLLARFKYREAEYDEGTEYLDEAINIYNDIGDYNFYARCLDLKGRLFFTLGKNDEANNIFKFALSQVEKSGTFKEQVEFLNKIGRIHLESQQIKQAKEYFNKAKDISLREDLLEHYAESVKNLAQIAHINKNYEDRNSLLLNGIRSISKMLNTVESEIRKAFLIGEIGFFYEGMENYHQSLTYYQRAKKLYSTLNDIGGIANCLGSIARIKYLLGEKKEEYDTYRELKMLVTGTPYYDLIAGAAINLGDIQMQIGNLNEAKILFQEAKYLCLKYNLRYTQNLLKLQKRLVELIKIRKPPELSFEQLINELFELVNWFPEAKDSILRLWFSGRKLDLISNYRSNPGLNFMVCQDDNEKFLSIAKVLKIFSDICLQIVESEYPGTGLDIIPFPKDKQIFFDCSIPYAEQVDENVRKIGFLAGGINSQYALTGGSTATSKITGNVGLTITGWSIGLPPQAHQLILSRTAKELIDNKIFFLPYERYLANDKLLSDLNISKEFKLIPVYFEKLPKSENIEVLFSKEIDLPILSLKYFSTLSSSLREIKKKFTNLLSVRDDTAQSMLSDINDIIEELSNSASTKNYLRLQIYVLYFPVEIMENLQVAIVIKKRITIAST